MKLKMLLLAIIVVCGCGDFNMGPTEPDECSAFIGDLCWYHADCCEGRCLQVIDFDADEILPPTCVSFEEEEDE